MGVAFALLPKGTKFHNQTLWGAIGWAAIFNPPANSGLLDFTAERDSTNFTAKSS